MGGSRVPIKRFFAPSRFRVQEHRNECVHYYYYYFFFLYFNFDCLHSASAFLLFAYNTLDRHYTKRVISGIVISWPRPHRRASSVHTRNTKTMTKIYCTMVVCHTFFVVAPQFYHYYCTIYCYCVVYTVINTFLGGERNLRNFYVPV